MFGPVGFAGGPGRARAGGRSGPPRPTGRGGPHHERPGISAKECKTDRKILCKPHVKQLLSNPRVIRASCLTAERVPRGSASRQPDGLVGLAVLSISLFQTLRRAGTLTDCADPPHSYGLRVGLSRSLHVAPFRHSWRRLQGFVSLLPIDKSRRHVWRGRHTGLVPTGQVDLSLPFFVAVNAARATPQFLPTCLARPLGRLQGLFCSILKCDRPPFPPSLNPPTTKKTLAANREKHVLAVGFTATPKKFVSSDLL